MQIEKFKFDKKACSGILDLEWRFIMLTKYSLFACLALLSALFLAGLIPQGNPQIMPFKGSNLAQELFIERAAIHDEALARIKADFAISDEKWAFYLDYFEALKASDDLIGTPIASYTNSDNSDITGLATKIMLEYGINPERVKLVNSSEGHAEAFQDLDENNKVIHRLELNETWLKGFSKSEQEAFLRHEIMHLINYDSLEASYVCGVLEELGLKSHQYNYAPSMIKYYQQRELRADLLAMIDNADCAQAMQNYFSECAQHDVAENRIQWTTHPSNEQRAQELAQLISTMNTAQTTFA